jgi:hypothetical protein
MSETESKWYYDPATGEVAQGKTSAWSQRMGPYNSREEAANAMTIAQARTEQADAQDEAEREREDDWGEDDWGES